MKSVKKLANDIRSMETAEGPFSTGISIVIPYYRRPVTLTQTLYSISRLDYNLSCIEVVIVDDGSPVGERPSIDVFEKLFKIRVLYQKDQGYRLSTVRNFGIREAVNDYVVILDCDMAVAPQFLNRHISVLLKNHRTISVGLRESRRVSDRLDPSEFANVDPSEIGEFVGRDWRLVTHLDVDINYLYSNAAWTLCSGGNVAFRKSDFYEIGEFCERFNFWGGEDTEWAYRAYKKGFYFHMDLELQSYHFECRDFEYQVDRNECFSEQRALLSDLVPAFEDAYLREGETPYVSVFVTHYNKLEYLNECVRSIEFATSMRFEVVIVDDGSSCSPVDILEQIPQALLKNVRIFYLNGHFGAEYAYKYAIERCRGEFIAQLDADDYLLPGAIDKLLDALKETPADIAYGRHKVLKDGELREGWVCKESTSEMRTLAGMYYHPLRVFSRKGFA